MQTDRMKKRLEHPGAREYSDCARVHSMHACMMMGRHLKQDGNFIHNAVKGLLDGDNK